VAFFNSKTNKQQRSRPLSRAYMHRRPCISRRELYDVDKWSNHGAPDRQAPLLI